MYKLKGGEEIKGSKVSVGVLFCGERERGGVGLWLILLNPGYYSLYEKSCILEIEN